MCEVRQGDVAGGCGGDFKARRYTISTDDFGWNCSSEKEGQEGEEEHLVLDSGDAGEFDWVFCDNIYIYT